MTKGRKTLDRGVIVARGEQRQAKLAKWRADVGEARFWKANLRSTIARLERKLNNSMAYIVQPEPRDLERWRAMQADLEARKLALAELEAGRTPQRPPERIQGLRRRERRAMAKAANDRNDGGDDAKAR